MERAGLSGDWQGSVYQKWAYRFMSNNMWRIAHQLGDIDDAMQEAAIEFTLMKRDYGDKVNSPQQFMALYKRCLFSHINNISIKDSRNRQTLTKIEAKEPTVRPDAELTVLLNEGSSELKEVLKIFFNAPNEVMEVLRKEVSSYSPKQFWNHVLKYLGIAPARSKVLTEELTRLLTPTQQYTRKDIVAAGKFVQQLHKVKAEAKT